MASPEPHKRREHRPPSWLTPEVRVLTRSYQAALREGRDESDLRRRLTTAAVREAGWEAGMDWVYAATRQAVSRQAETPPVPKRDVSWLDFGVTLADALVYGAVCGAVIALPMLLFVWAFFQVE